MKCTYRIEPLNYKVIEELPNSWGSKNYLELLEQMEFDGASEIAEAELKEMCCLALTDYESDEAAKVVLEYLFKDRLNEGQLNNLAHEIGDEKMWEEYADLSMHEEFFNATQLLYEAFNGSFPQPEAVQFQIRLLARKPMDLEVFNNHKEAMLIRLLVQGMPENTKINRLFQDQLKEGNFTDAKDIIWQLKVIEQKDLSLTFDVISSLYWFQDIRHTEEFDAQLNWEQEDS